MKQDEEIEENKAINRQGGLMDRISDSEGVRGR